MHWFTHDWWDYVINGAPYSRGTGRAGFSWRAFWCRLRNHPAGVAWYTPYQLEPDTHCQNCGDDLV